MLILHSLAVYNSTNDILYNDVTSRVFKLPFSVLTNPGTGEFPILYSEFEQDDFFHLDLFNVLYLLVLILLILADLHQLTYNDIVTNDSL